MEPNAGTQAGQETGGRNLSRSHGNFLQTAFHAQVQAHPLFLYFIGQQEPY